MVALGVTGTIGVVLATGEASRRRLGGLGPSLGVEDAAAEGVGDSERASWLAAAAFLRWIASGLGVAAVRGRIRDAKEYPSASDSATSGVTQVPAKRAFPDLFAPVVS